MPPRRPRIPQMDAQTLVPLSVNIPPPGRRTGGRGHEWFILAEYKRLLPGHRYPAHAHTSGLFEIYAVMAGRVSMTAVGRGPIDLHVGLAVLLPPSPAHGMSSGPGAVVINVHFPLMEPRDWGTLVGRAAGRVLPLSPPALEALRQMLLLNTYPAATRPHLARALLTIVLAQAGRKPDGAADAAPGPLAARIQWLIETRLAQPIRNAELARSVGMGLRTLEERYRRESGEPLHRTIVRLRLERAMRLLAEGREPVKRVAGLSGFRDPAYFVRAFKAAFGVTPGEVRRPG